MDALLRERELNPKTDLCGFLLETFQGWGAVLYPQEFVQEVEIFARENDILLAFDEMQSGFGRLGTLFGYMQYGVEPDILCCGKGASSGLPLSIVMARREIMDLPPIGSMSSTHSANPLACAAGLANLQALIQDGLIENSRVLGESFHTRLNEIRSEFPGYIRYVLGRGLLAALHFVDRNGNALVEIANTVCQEAMRLGLLVVHTGRETIKLAPPLCINEDAMNEGLNVLRDSIKAVVGQRNWRW